MGQAVFVDKGTQPKLRQNKNKIALLIRVSDFLYTRHFLGSNSLKCSILLYILCTHNQAKLSLSFDFLNGHQNVCMNTGSDPKCDTFDGKNRDK